MYTIYDPTVYFFSRYQFTVVLIESENPIIGIHPIKVLIFESSISSESVNFSTRCLLDINEL